MITVSAETAAAIFAAAAKGRGTRTNLGYRVEVSVGGYSYAVTLEKGYLAYCDVREGWGGTEYIKQVNATPEQNRALLRIHGSRM